MGPARQHGRRDRPRRWPPATTRPSEVAELLPGRTPTTGTAPIVDQGAVVDGVFEQDATSGGTRKPPRPAVRPPAQRRRSRRLRPRRSTRLPDAGRHAATASARNAWVVDGEHSTTGKPLLANDPHLGVVSCRASGIRWACTARRSAATCPLDVAGFTFSGRARRGHRPQRRHRLGVHQPRPRRHRPLPGAGRRRPLALRRRAAAAARCATRRSRSRGERRRDAHGARRPRTGRCSPTSSDSSRDVGANAPVAGTARRGDGYAVSLAWTALTPGTHRRRDLRARHRRPTGTSSGRRPRTSRCPRRTSCTPTAPATSATRRPGRIPIRKSGNDGRLPVGRAGCRENDWTGDYVPFDGAAQRARPRATGFVVTANQAVIGPDYPYYLTDDWDHGYRSPADPRPARAPRREAVASRTWPASSSTPATRSRPTLVPYLLDVDLPARLLLRRPAAAARLGLPAAAPTAAAAAYFNVGVAQPARADLPRRAARATRGPTAATAGSRWCARLLDEPDDPLVGRRRDRRRRRDPRRHPARRR